MKAYMKPTSVAVMFCTEGIIALSGFDVDSEKSGSDVLSKRKGWNSSDWTDKGEIRDDER